MWFLLGVTCCAPSIFLPGDIIGDGPNKIDSLYTPLVADVIHGDHSSVGDMSSLDADVYC